MDNIILIDGNSLGYAAHGVRELTAGGQQVQAIFFTLKMIKAVLESYSDRYHKVAVLWDSRAKWRFDLYPEYKGKRDDTPEKKASRDAYKAQVPQIRKALSLLGIEQMIAKDEEADDLAAALVHNRKPGQKILLVSGDRDWLQLVSNDVSWFDPREDGRFVDAANFREKTGFSTVVQFVQAKAILGDASDSIAGVSGLGEKAIANLFALFGGVAGFIKAAKDHEASTGRQFEKGDLPAELSRFRTKLNDFAFGDQIEVFKRNMTLMNLLSKRHQSTEILDKIVSAPGAFDEDGFLEFCHERSFLSIARSIHEWRRVLANYAITPSTAEVV